MASTAATAPSSAWAKFTMRLARYTSTTPMASRAMSEPNTTPRTTMPSGRPRSMTAASTAHATPAANAGAALRSTPTTRQPSG